MRWADLDLLGHVNNVVYVDYLQEARVDMLRVHGRGPQALAEGLVVVRHEVTYLKPLTFDFRPVSIECWVTDVKAATFTMGYEIFHDLADGDRIVYLRATTVLTPYVFAEERPRRISAEERAALEGHLEPDHQPRRRTPPLPEPAAHSYPIHVRFSDVDVYGHVNNVKYFEYFQEARIQLMVAQGGELGDGYHLVVAQTDVDYRRPILFRPEPYDCRTWVSRVGSTSVVFESVVRDGDQLLARARVVGVCIDNESGRPAPVPDAFRELAAG
jgi:acyl-CoA thioester hydrolase